MRLGLCFSAGSSTRRSAQILCVVCALILGALASGAAAGLRVNATPSMPRGLWQLATGKMLVRGMTVVVCPPERPDMRAAKQRGYIPAGNCPGGYEPLVKPIAAMAGDVVTVTGQGIAVNDKPISGTAPLKRDDAGRRLHPVPPGSYRVQWGDVWLLSTHDPRSFDSRYFGPVPLAKVQGVARPIWVFR